LAGVSPVPGLTAAARCASAWTSNATTACWHRRTNQFCHELSRPAASGHAQAASFGPIQLAVTDRQSGSCHWRHAAGRLLIVRGPPAARLARLSAQPKRPQLTAMRSPEFRLRRARCRRVPSFASAQPWGESPQTGEAGLFLARWLQAGGRYIIL